MLSCVSSKAWLLGPNGPAATSLEYLSFRTISLDSRVQILTSSGTELYCVDWWDNLKDRF